MGSDAWAKLLVWDSYRWWWEVCGQVSPYEFCCPWMCRSRCSSALKPRVSCDLVIFSWCVYVWCTPKFFFAMWNGEWRRFSPGEWDVLAVVNVNISHRGVWGCFSPSVWGCFLPGACVSFLFFTWWMRCSCRGECKCFSPWWVRMFFI